MTLIMGISLRSDYTLYCRQHKTANFSFFRVIFIFYTNFRSFNDVGAEITCWPEG